MQVTHSMGTRSKGLSFVTSGPTSQNTASVIAGSGWVGCHNSVVPHKTSPADEDLLPEGGEFELWHQV